MKSKHLIILGIVFVILLAVTLIKKWTKPQAPKEEKLVDIIEALIMPETLTRCQIDFSEKEVVLSRKENTWVVENQFDALVDMDKWEPLLTKLDKLEGELRTDKEELLKDYGIADEEGIHIKLEDGQVQVADVIIGTKKVGFSKNFVRNAGSNAVYIVYDNVLSELGLWGEISAENFLEDYWVDKRIMHIDYNNVKSVELKKEGQVYLHIIGEMEGRKKWKIATTYSFIVDPTKVQRYVKGIADAKATEVISPEEQGGFDSDKWMITVQMDDDSVHEMILGKRIEDHYYLKTAEKNHNFKIGDHIFEKMDKTDGDFFMTNFFMVNPDTINELYIKDAQARKTYQISRKEREGDEDPVWQLSKGKELDTDSVMAVLGILRDAKLKTMPETAPSLKKLLTIKIDKTDGPSQEYEVTREHKLNETVSCHFLKLAKDEKTYCMSPEQVSSLREALVKMYKERIQSK